MSKVNFEQLLKDYINSCENATEIKNLLSKQGIAFKDGEFVKQSGIVSGLIDARPLFRNGEIIIDASDTNLTPLRVINSKMNFILAENMRTGEECNIQYSPLLRNWCISDAKKGDIIATDDFVFMFKNLESNIGSDTVKVKYICAALLCNNRTEPENVFHIPPFGAHMGTVQTTYYRFASQDQQKFLLEEAKKHGYILNDDKTDIIYEQFIYSIGTWIVDMSNNNTVYKVIDFFKNKYILETLDGTRTERYYTYINCTSRVRTWSIKDAKAGDVLHIEKDMNGYEWLLLFKKLDNLFTIDCPVKYCIDSDSVITSTTAIPFNTIEPASKDEMERMYDVLEKASIDWKAVTSNREQRNDKFAAGDWIVKNSNPNTITQILGTDGNKYCFNGYSVRKTTIEKHYSKWTIDYATNGKLYLLSGYMHSPEDEEPEDYLVLFKEFSNGIMRAHKILSKKTGIVYDNVSFCMNEHNYKSIYPASTDDSKLFIKKTEESKLEKEKSHNVDSRQEINREFNRKILELLEDFLERNPSLRFSQMIENMNHDAENDLFTEEPKVTYERFKKYIENNTNNK